MGETVSDDSFQILQNSLLKISPRDAAKHAEARSLDYCVQGLGVQLGGFIVTVYIR